MGDHTETIRLRTTGMHCRSCSMLVDMTLSELDGVVSSTTDLVSGLTQVEIDPTAVSTDDLVGAVRSAGYEAELTQ